MPIRPGPLLRRLKTCRNSSKPPRLKSKCTIKQRLRAVQNILSNVTGLVSFQLFSSNPEASSITLIFRRRHSQGQNNTTGNGSTGATLRQTIFGLQGYGPRIGGVRTSANVDLDFFGGLAYTSYGTSAGTVRMRTASINLDWALRFDSSWPGGPADLATFADIVRNDC